MAEQNNIESYDKAIQLHEALLEKLRIEKQTLSEDDRVLINDSYERVVLANMGDAELTIENEEKLNLTSSRKVAEVNKTRADTIRIMEETKSSVVKANAETEKLKAETEQIRARIELDQRKVDAEIKKLESEAALADEEKKQSKWKIWGPVLGTVGSVTLVLIAEKVAGIVMTGKAPNFIRKY